MARKWGRGFERQAGQGPRVALVGPCGAGKSTVVGRLRALGFDARMPAQEHSGVPDMWQKLLEPDLLVLLDAPNEVLRGRRPGIPLSDELLARERRRLRHAQRHAHLHLDSSQLSPDEIVGIVLRQLEADGLMGEA